MSDTTHWEGLVNADLINGLISHHKRYPKAWALAENEVINSFDSKLSHWHRSWLAGMRRWDKIVPEQTKRSKIWDLISSHSQTMAGAVLALIVYEDSPHLLEQSSSELISWATISDNPAGWLLLPAAIALDISRCNINDKDFMI